MIVIIKRNPRPEHLLNIWKLNTIGFVIFSFIVGIGFGYWWATNVIRG